MRLRIRRAKIADDLREQFEMYGADEVSLALGLGVLQAVGLSGLPGDPTRALALVHKNQDAAAAWLRERATWKSGAR